MKRLLLALVALFLVGPVRSDGVEGGELVHVVGVPFTTLIDHNWPVEVEVPRFDASLGELVGVDIVLQVIVQGEWFGEYMGAGSSIWPALNWDLDAGFALFVPGGAIPVGVSHDATSGVLPPFDGAIDFAGPSGYFESWELRTRTGWILVSNGGNERSPWVGEGATALQLDCTNVNTLLTILCNGSCVIGSRADAGSRIAVRYRYI